MKYSSENLVFLGKLKSTKFSEIHIREPNFLRSTILLHKRMIKDIRQWYGNKFQQVPYGMFSFKYKLNHDV